MCCSQSGDGISRGCWERIKAQKSNHQCLVSFHCTLATFSQDHILNVLVSQSSSSDIKTTHSPLWLQLVFLCSCSTTWAKSWMASHFLASSNTLVDHQSPLVQLYFFPTKPAAAAAAKSLHSCVTLCDPIDGSPPGCAVPGILQARTLEWVAISFSNAWKWKVKVKSLSHDPMDCSPPGSSIHGIFQARVLEWGPRPCVRTIQLIVIREK